MLDEHSGSPFNLNEQYYVFFLDREQATTAVAARERQKAIGLHVHHAFLFCTFFTFVTRIGRKSTLFHVLWRTGTQDNDSEVLSAGVPQRPALNLEEYKWPIC